MILGVPLLATCDAGIVAPSPVVPTVTVSVIDSFVGMHPLRRVDTLPVPHTIAHPNHSSGLAFGALEIRRDSTFTRWTLQTVYEVILGDTYEYWRIDEGFVSFGRDSITLHVTGMNGPCSTFARTCERTPVQGLGSARLARAGAMILLRSDWMPGYGEFQYEVAQIGASAGTYQLWKFMDATVPAQSTQECSSASQPIVVQSGSLVLEADGRYVRRTTKTGGCRGGEYVDSGRTYLAGNDLRLISFDLSTEEAVLGADSVAGMFVADMTLSRQTRNFLLLRHVYRR